MLKNISEHLKCPNCGSRYDIENVHYLGKIQVFYVLQLFCVRCGIPVFASVLVRDRRKSGMKQMLSELSRQDLVRIPAEIIDSDHVLDFHSFIKNYEGSLSELIK